MQSPSSISSWKLNKPSIPHSIFLSILRYTWADYPSAAAFCPRHAPPHERRGRRNSRLGHDKHTGLPHGSRSLLVIINKICFSSSFFAISRLQRLLSPAPFWHVPTRSKRQVARLVLDLGGRWARIVVFLQRRSGRTLSTLRAPMRYPRYQAYDGPMAFCVIGALKYPKLINPGVVIISAPHELIPSSLPRVALSQAGSAFAHLDICPALPQLVTLSVSACTYAVKTGPKFFFFYQGKQIRQK